MKTTFLILAAATLSGLAAESVNFPFEVSGKQMPAGKYVVRDAGPSHALRISEEKTGHGFFVVGPTAKGTAKTMLNFNRYGDAYVLTSVTNNGAVLNLPNSRRTTESATETIAVAVTD